MWTVNTALLLDTLRAELGPGVDLLDEPELLTGGFYTSNLAFRVTGGPPGWEQRWGRCCAGPRPCWAGCRG
jgi:hypothetical protein